MYRVSSWRTIALRFAAVVAVTGVIGAGLVVTGAGVVVLGAARPAGALVDPITPLSPNATWLETLNAWRAASGLGPVGENADWSAGDVLHSTYMVETGDFAHIESLTGSPYYTDAGNTAGQSANIAASSDATKNDRRFVEQWITAPFHAAGMLDPVLTTSGFGSYRHAGRSPAAAATLDVLRGRDGTAAAAPTVFPGDGSVLPVPQQAYKGGESPDPLSPCAGFNPTPGSTNPGTPLFALLPREPMAGSLIASVTRGGVPVETCQYDETSYTNSDGPAQTLGRSVLASRHQVVVVPRLPLTQGSTYAVSLSVVYVGEMAPTVTAWSFTAGTQPEVSIGNASVVEGAARSRLVRLTVSLSRLSSSPVSVAYATAPGTASAGSDFVAKSGTATIAPGSTSAVLSIAVKGDRVAELNEAFTVNLTNPQGATLRRSTGTISIISDDRFGTESTAPRLSIGNASIVEGDSGSRAMRVTVTLSAASQLPVRVHYATAFGTASADDFIAKSGIATIPARSTSTVLTIRVKPDEVTELTELFTVTLSIPVGAALDRATATGAILNDD